MKYKLFFLVAALFLQTPHAFAWKVFNLNVFDQLQGDWSADFREKRMNAIASYISQEKPDIVVFQEAKGILPGEKKGGEDSVDAMALTKKYPYRRYIHEMTGKDGASYGYWMGAKKEPKKWIEDGFAFPGGVERRVQAAVWDTTQDKCLGVLSLHLSYQDSKVRQKEAQWVLSWIKAHESECKQWLVVGDFNANQKNKEMKIFFSGGLPHAYKTLKPTVGAFNPIRRIYGEHIPSETIDWALSHQVEAQAQVVLDKPWEEQWVSDHAGILIQVK